MPPHAPNLEIISSTHSSVPTWILVLTTAIANFAAGLFELIAPVALAQKLRFTPSDMRLYLFALGTGFAIPQLGKYSRGFVGLGCGA